MTFSGYFIQLDNSCVNHWCTVCISTACSQLYTHKNRTTLGQGCCKSERETNSHLSTRRERNISYQWGGGKCRQASTSVHTRARKSIVSERMHCKKEYTARLQCHSTRLSSLDSPHAMFSRISSRVWSPLLIVEHVA